MAYVWLPETWKNGGIWDGGRMRVKTAGDVCPSPQSIVPVKSVAFPLGFVSVNVATWTLLSGVPAVPVTVGWAGPCATGSA